MALSLTDLESKDLTALADLGQAQLGSKDTVAPVSFLDFDEHGAPREIRATVKATDLIGKTDTIGQSAVTKAKVAYQAMPVKDRAVLRGMLGVDADGAIKVMAESYATELVKDLLAPKSMFTQDGGSLKIGDISLDNVNVNGATGAAGVKTLQLPALKHSGFFGLDILTP